MIFWMMFLLSVGMVVFNSCSKDSALETSSVDLIKSFRFSKTITVADASGLNSIEIIISANDKSILNNYMAEDLELHVFENLEQLKEAKSKSYHKHSESSYSELADDNVGVNEVTEVTADFTYTNPVLQDGMQVYYVSRSKNFKEDEDLRYRAYQIYTFTNSPDNARVERNCAWPFHNVYVRWNYVNTAEDYLNENWTVGQEEFSEIDNGDYQIISEPNSYRIRIFIKSQYADCFDDAPFWY